MEIKWERLHPAQPIVRKGFDDLYAEHNGAALYVTISLDHEYGLTVAWSVNRKPLGIFKAEGFCCFHDDASDEELSKAYKLAKDRAEAFAKCWVEK